MRAADRVGANRDAIGRLRKQRTKAGMERSEMTEIRMGADVTERPDKNAEICYSVSSTFRRRSLMTLNPSKGGPSFRNGSWNQGYRNRPAVRS